MPNLILSTKNTWCPGCGNFAIQGSLKKIIQDRDSRRHVLVTGIGCHGKMADYFNINSFYALHGRAIPAAVGIKIANPELNVICVVGDGDAYSEGISHLLHAAKRNANITVLVHDNHAFSLTVKQFTATSPRGFVSNSSPGGNIEDPLNPLHLLLSAGATFVARGYAGDTMHLSTIIQKGIEHNGFSFIEILQPCVAWYNTFTEYNERVYKMNEEELSLEEAEKKAKEWDYNSKEAKIPLGIFYKTEKSVPERQMGEITFVDVQEILEGKI